MPNPLTTLLTFAVSVAITGDALAIADPDNLGQWDKPAKTGPDKECPGFLVNLGPTGAFVVQPSRNLHERAYYMSPRIHPTAAMVLALGTDKPRLRIQGVTGKPLP